MARVHTNNIVRKMILDALVMYRDQQREDAEEVQQLDHTVTTAAELRDLANAADEIHQHILDNDYEIVYAKGKAPKKGSRK